MLDQLLAKIEANFRWHRFHESPDKTDCNRVVVVTVSMRSSFVEPSTFVDVAFTTNQEVVGNVIELSGFDMKLLDRSNQQNVFSLRRSRLGCCVT